MNNSLVRSSLPRSIAACYWGDCDLSFFRIRMHRFRKNEWILVVWAKAIQNIGIASFLSHFSTSILAHLLLSLLFIFSHVCTNRQTYKLTGSLLHAHDNATQWLTAQAWSFTDWVVLLGEWMSLFCVWLFASHDLECGSVVCPSVLRIGGFHEFSVIVVLEETFGHESREFIEILAKQSFLFEFNEFVLVSLQLVFLAGFFEFSFTHFAVHFKFLLPQSLNLYGGWYLRVIVIWHASLSYLLFMLEFFLSATLESELF